MRESKIQAKRRFITLTYLRSQYRYNGRFLLKKLPPIVQKYESRAGAFDRHGYRIISINGAWCSEHSLVWFYVTGYWPKRDLDHINQIKDDNNFENLREVTQEENSKNRPLRRDNKTGVAGVFYNEKARSWTVTISVKKKPKRLGTFKNFDEAVKCRKKAELRYEYHQNHGRAV